MVDIVVAPINGDLITPDGIPTVEFYVWLDQVTDAVNNIAPLTGIGSPESVLVSSPGRWYVDTSATSTYYKESGEGDTGWLLIT